MYATSITVLLSSIGMVLLGWLFFRRPGVGFWTFAPVWRANHYLKPPGAALWIAGCVVGPVGAVLLFVYGRA
jgi:ABC-type phosphate transport system permease subunit